MFGFEDLGFEYFFQVAAPILRTATACDSRFRVGCSSSRGHDLELAIRAAGQAGFTLRVGVFALGEARFDTLFDIRLFTASATRFRIMAAAEVSHAIRLLLEAAGAESGHATLFTVREEDRFTN